MTLRCRAWAGTLPRARGMGCLRYLIRVSATRLLDAVGQELFHNARRIHVCDYDGAAVGADILRVVADQSVTLAGDATLELAGRGHGKPLRSGFLGLHL